MTQNVHPSRWQIRKEPGKHSQALILPLGPDTRPYKTTTKLMNKVYAEWDGQAKTMNAGDFATALRELHAHNIDLAAIPQVSKNGVDTVYAWLEEFELKVSQHHLQVKAVVKQEVKTLKAREDGGDKYDHVFLAALNGFAAHTGPLVDPKLLNERAKAVADAYLELQ